MHDPSAQNNTQQDNTQQVNINSDNASPASEGLQETFISHLVELRDRIIKAALAIIIIFMSLVYWAPEIFHLFAQPLLAALPSGGKMIVTDITGSFFVPMKVTMLVAFVIALPVVMYQLWAFIAPGLYTHERRLIVPLVVSSYSLFIIGMSFAYFLVFPTVFKFMAHYNAPLGAEMLTDIDNYLSFAMTTFLAFGITFEVPVVVVVLVRMGVVPLAKLREIRPYVIVGAFVVAAVVTPPDILSQLLLAVPMSLLYELGLFIARFYEKKPAQVSDKEATDGAATNA
ncbi:twin-arginine translocase subunit TatC [Polynucleobacter sp. IMCC 29146]|uniref:twin-arginine translocase subunit TatC n=1 Tax=Polynucleobacter sp. IMCC 29146 TaxID=2780953 RepID=UPI001F3B486A|nr:twin-arginine translocase subunit TatC [Polynucleobacter sp. IMCC 29146]MCE7528521.1 twin-arginine translocase subunit TatC [Polynucleobacter sp. IMCC 29146]